MRKLIDLRCSWDLRATALCTTHRMTTIAPASCIALCEKSKKKEINFTSVTAFCMVDFSIKHGSVLWIKINSLIHTRSLLDVRSDRSQSKTNVYLQDAAKSNPQSCLPSSEKPLRIITRNNYIHYLFISAYIGQAVCWCCKVTSCETDVVILNFQQLVQ